MVLEALLYLRKLGGVMRAVLGVVSLLIVLAVVGLLAKWQLGVDDSSGVAGSASGEAASQQSRQVQQQIKATVEGLMQARPVPDDK